MNRKKKIRSRVRRVTLERRLLEEMNTKLTRMESNLDTVNRGAVRQGATAGGVAGGLVGAIVSLFVALAKSKHGL
ncbi:hypothetical protein FOT62_22725 [Serratia marcescens]|uniref:Uncharacterized protein n=1 Tax=Serratia marcescens TaxID=615 RepID=A0A5C7BV00_SERMA|nr:MULTISPECIES: hypothetical protein [Serratia]TXE27137.1 hypothetical protein FOT62_22725 [Serratia marcescens]TXE55306.1 hypothetical protein FOT56_25440 [Serratia marcescens]